VRQSARASTDLSNLRQLGVAMMSYAVENKDRINVPLVFGSPADAWTNHYWIRAAPYIANRNLASGTATTAALVEQFKNRTVPDNYQQTYMNVPQGLPFAANKGLCGRLPTGASSTELELRFRRLAQYKNYLSATPYIAVGKWGFVTATPGPMPASVPSEGVYWPYGGNRTIVVYLDGHAAYRETAITAEETYRDYNPNLM
jgi:prepilin-type processing-associated H-X9-DG protein